MINTTETMAIVTTEPNVHARRRRKEDDGTRLAILARPSPAHDPAPLSLSATCPLNVRRVQYGNPAKMPVMALKVSAIVTIQPVDRRKDRFWQTRQTESTAMFGLG